VFQRFRQHRYSADDPQHIFVEHRSSQVPEEILTTIMDTLSYGGAVTQVTDKRNDLGAAVVIGPEHAQLIAARGWSKQDCKQIPVRAIWQAQA
jgi:hypothetical protein